MPIPVRIISIPNDYGEAAQFVHNLGGRSLREAQDAIHLRDIVFADARTALDFVNLISKLGGHAYLNVSGSPATRGAPRPPVVPMVPPVKPSPKSTAPKLLPFAKILLGEEDPFD